MWAKPVQHESQRLDWRNCLGWRQEVWLPTVCSRVSLTPRVWTRCSGKKGRPMQSPPRRARARSREGGPSCYSLADGDLVSALYEFDSTSALAFSNLELTKPCHMFVTRIRDQSIGFQTAGCGRWNTILEQDIAPRTARSTSLKLSRERAEHVLNQSIRKPAG